MSCWTIDGFFSEELAKFVATVEGIHYISKEYLIRFKQTIWHWEKTYDKYKVQMSVKFILSAVE